MTIKGAKQVHYDSGPNMTPLVDVVMVILIFLMLAGSFGADSWYLTSSQPIKPPDAQQDEPGAGDVKPEVVEIRIFGDGNGFRVVGDNINSQGTVPTREWLVERLAAKKKMLESQGTPEGLIQVVLAPTATVRYEQIALVYEAAIKAQFKKVAFRASH